MQAELSCQDASCHDDCVAGASAGAGQSCKSQYTALLECEAKVPASGWILFLGRGRSRGRGWSVHDHALRVGLLRFQSDHHVGRLVAPPARLRLIGARLTSRHGRRYGASPRFWVLNAFATMLASMVAPARLVCVASLPSAWNFSAAALDPSELYQAVERDVRSM